MKVVRKQNASCEKWFMADEITTVLMLSVSGSGGSQLLLWSQKQLSVGLFSVNDFEIVDSSLPKAWTASIDLNGNIALAPSEWVIDGFWEKYHDEDTTALETFRKWRTHLETIS
jgi:hypothetical protein